VRLLAPGDDLAHPFFADERLAHAESSAAAALAAGVLLLVIANNPHLHVADLFALVQRCALPAAPFPPETLESFADPADARPLGRDPDGHDAKHGYGRLQALRTCVAARDPIALELLAIGEDAAAIAWFDARQGGKVASVYSSRFAALAVRALLADAASEHAVRGVLRHLRLVNGDPRRIAAHPVGALARQLALALRSLARDTDTTSDEWWGERGRLEQAVRRASESPGEFESSVLDVAERVFRRTERSQAATLPIPGTAAEPAG
jgi:hypothetical protein